MKRILLPLLAAITLPTAINAENKYPLFEWIKSDISERYETRFLGCKRGICQKQTRRVYEKEPEFPQRKWFKHVNYDCKNFRWIEELPDFPEKEDYQEYVWEYPRIGTNGEEDFDAVCSHKGGYDYKK